MDPRPLAPPTSQRGPIIGPARAVVDLVHPDGTVTVRLQLSRGGRSNVPVVVGLELEPGDRVLLDLIDGDACVPIITAKLPAGAFAV